MEKIPVFNEFGFIQTTPLKIPIGFWIVLAFILGSLAAYLYLESEKEGNKKPVLPNVPSEIA